MERSSPSPSASAPASSGGLPALPALPPATRGERLTSTAALAAIPLILFLLGSILFGEFSRSGDLRREVNRSFETRLAIQRILSLHQDIETGQRGFVVAGSPEFLAPYEAARAQIDPALQALRNDPALREDLAALEVHSAAQREFAGRMVALRRSNQVDRAMFEIASGRGKRIMDAIRRHVASMDATERQRLAARVAAAEKAQRDAQFFTFGLLGLLALLLFAATITNARSMRARREALVRLEGQSARLRAILDSAKDGVIILNASGSIESINPAAARMYGYSQEELVRRDIGMLFEIAPERGVVETFLRRLQLDQEQGAGAVREFAARRKDGTAFPTDVAISPVILPDATRFVAIVRDATDRKAVEQMKSEFVSTVSHELRTPLTSIAGSLGLLAGGAAGALPERAARLIAIAHSNSERLVRLINDILDMEKIESGKMRFDIEPVALAPLIDLVIQSNRGFADQHDVVVEQGPIREDARIFADPDRMIQVLTNLLSNAIKFSPPGDRVTVSVSPLDRRYRITVADRGPGVPEEFGALIFTKFAQADSTDTRQKGGTGLGLSIVKEIVTRLGGTVSFDSRPGQGASFHVDLPSADAVTDSGRIESGELGRAGEPRLLHVEDDPDMLRLVASAFDGRAQVFSTPSVEEARAAILRHDFDAVVLDIGMADGSGLELIPLLRKHDPGAPIVIFTAQDAGDEVTASVDAVLVKSRSSLDRLVSTVESLLAGAGQSVQGLA